MTVDIFLKYLGVFAVGGILCTIAQILLDKTKLTSARILVLYVVSGVVLTAINIYDYIIKIRSFKATIPLLRFGYSLCKKIFKLPTSYATIYV